MNFDRIFLIGMPYSGKSTLGLQLAQDLGWRFLDMDEAIELHEKKTIPEIFKLYGEGYFREAEKKVLHRIGIANQAVIATGGGAACFFDNIDWMKDRGKVIFLHQEIKTLAARAMESKQVRPLIQSKDYFELIEDFQKLFEHRVHFYKQAHQTISNPQALTLQDLA